MSKIVIYDTEHFETTYALIRIVDLEFNSITIFADKTTETVLRQMLGEHANKFTWVTRSKTDYTTALALYRYCTVHNVTVLFLNTVSHHHLLIAVTSLCLKKVNVILTVHAANSFFSPKISFSPRSILRFLGQKLLRISVSSYAALLSSIRDYIVENFKIKKNVYLLPGGVFEPDKIKSLSTDPNSQLRIVVPGSIDHYRRDYQQIFELANLLELKKQNIQLILLGTAVGTYGKNVIRQCESLILKHVQLRYYDVDFIDPVEYEHQLDSCDFIFLPLTQMCKKPGEQAEEYGRTICSGSFYDAIRFAKPILIAENIPLAPELQDQCFPFPSLPGLCEILSKMSHGEREEITTKAFRNSQRFSVTLLRKEIEPLIAPI
ncbi:MAG TPA: hypothetical protein VGN63_06945 [Flavisolibacter sp.]|jgi:hypothetical protein|nr:hypothetical protein [Flavisolibacter sp.]